MLIKKKISLYKKFTLKNKKIKELKSRKKTIKRLFKSKNQSKKA